MNSLQLLFYAAAGLTLFGALVVLFTSRLVQAAFALVLSLLGIAVVYVLLGATFLAIAQVLVYVGGVLVLIIFGMMLTHTLRDGQLISESGYQWRGGLVTSALFLLGFWGFKPMDWSAITWMQSPRVDPSLGNMRQIGIGLMSDWVFPFELAGVLLLLALLGAAWLSGSLLYPTRKP
jgi:NADH:ubiquinone oxidoreductase subunit 6 (subunit J)